LEPRLNATSLKEHNTYEYYIYNIYIYRFPEPTWYLLIENCTQKEKNRASPSPKTYGLKEGFPYWIILDESAIPIESWLSIKTTDVKSVENLLSFNYTC